MGLRTVAVGRVTRVRLPAMLLGLRAGTCHLTARTVGTREELLIGRLAEDECSWYMPTSVLPFALTAGGVSRGLHVDTMDATFAGVQLNVVSQGQPASVSRSDGSGWARGRVSEVAIGDGAARETWIAAAVGACFNPMAVDIDGHRLMLSKDQSGNCLAELNTTSPVNARSAQKVFDDVAWILRLATRDHFSIDATWDARGSEGVVRFDTISRSLSHDLLDPEAVSPYLRAAAASWTTRSGYERQLLRILIDMLLVACSGNLETSIVLTAAALELIAEEWLPTSKRASEVPKPQRDLIAAGFGLLTSVYAPNSELAKEAKNRIRHIFGLTAKQKFRELLSHLNITPDDEGVRTFVNMRNLVVHGGFQKRSREERITAMLFGRWMLSTCLLRGLEYSGNNHDWRLLSAS